MRLTHLLRKSAHLWFLLLLVIGGSAAALTVRARMVPASYGEIGPYRAEALADIASQPSRWHADSDCLECHQSVADERSGSLHEAVSCAHCHGVGTEHVRQARLAAESPETTVAAAAEWDGNLLTHVDLYVTKDRAICLSCHQDAVGMPADFKKINLAAHLEEQGASEPESVEVCSECHAGHNTAP